MNVLTSTTYMKELKQCNYLAEGFYKAGVKGVVLPAGGHGVYIKYG